MLRYTSILLLSLLTARSALADGEPTVIKITLKDHRMTPDKISLPEGSKAELVVTNADATTEEFESKALRIEKLIPAGKTITVKIGPLRAGSYDLMGDFHADTCKGQLTVP